ncbi:MAG: ComEC family competence protein [Chlorobium sp.]|jgi:competence protein ComEC|nr:MAG: ComEC family competence protein [Chlorobium sp.]
MPFSPAPYPAVRLLLVVISGILAGVYLPLLLEGWLSCCVLAISFLLGSLLYEKINPESSLSILLKTLSYSLFILFCFAAYSSFQGNYTPRNGLLQYNGKTVLLYGRVDERPALSKTGASWIMEVEEVFDNGKKLKLHDRVKVFLHSTDPSIVKVHYGDMVRVKGKLDLIPEASNRGEYNPRKAGRLKQVSVQLYCAGPWQVQQEGKSKLNAFEDYIVLPVYNYMIKSLNILMPEGEERKLASGVLIGEKESMADEVFEAFKLTGAAHILAVSGLNVGLLALAIHICLQRLKVTKTGRWLSFVLFVFILLVYSYVTGNSPSVKRAAFMSLVLIGGETFGKKTFPVNSLALADFLILLCDPLDLLNPGFLMTNGAVLSILLLYPRFTSPLSKNRGLFRATGHLLFSSVIVTLTAIIGVSPIIAYYFGTFSLISLFANLPIVLFSNLLMYDLVPMLLLNLVSSTAASFFAASSVFFADLTLKSAFFFGALPFASVNIKPDCIQIWIYYFLLLTLLFFSYGKAWGKFAVSLLFGVNILLWYSIITYSPPEAPAMLSVNLGKNLAAIISSGRETVLIDAGRVQNDPKRIARQLNEYGLTAPKAVIQFYTPDSLIAKVPATYHMLRDSTRLTLSSIVAVRPDEKVLKLWSRNHTLLMVSGTSRLKEEERYKADIVFLWVYRFADKQQQQIASWLNYAHPKRCILIPGSFLSRSHLVAMQHFTAQHPELEIRGKTSQIVVK